MQGQESASSLALVKCGSHTYFSMGVGDFANHEGDAVDAFKNVFSHDFSNTHAVFETISSFEKVGESGKNTKS